TGWLVAGLTEPAAMGVQVTVPQVWPKDVVGVGPMSRMPTSVALVCADRQEMPRPKARREAARLRMMILFGAGGAREDTAPARPVSGSRSRRIRLRDPVAQVVAVDASGKRQSSRGAHRNRHCRRVAPGNGCTAAPYAERKRLASSTDSKGLTGKRIGAHSPSAPLRGDQHAAHEP